MFVYTLKQIKTFQRSQRCNRLSISKAANALFVAQPAVTQQIKQLGEAFGLALIVFSLPSTIRTCDLGLGQILAAGMFIDLNDLQLRKDNVVY